MDWFAFRSDCHWFVNGVDGFDDGNVECRIKCFPKSLKGLTDSFIRCTILKLNTGEGLMMKTCGRCNVEKAESEFGVNNAKDDGLQGYCRDCMREYTATKRKLKRVDKVNKTADIVAYRKEYRKNNRDKVVALQTAWRKSHPEWCREKDRKKYERKMKANRGPDYVVGDPANMLFKTKPVMRIVGWRTDEEKAQSKRAKRRVQTALKNGTLVKLPCWTCGCLDVEGHHPDYDAPLDVVWLCKTHHLQVHKEHRPNEYVRVDK